MSYSWLSKLMDGWKASEATFLHKAAKECLVLEEKSYWRKITPSDHQLITFLKFNSIFSCVSILTPLVSYMKNKFKYHPLSSGPHMSVLHQSTHSESYCMYFTLDLIHDVFIFSPIKLTEECSGFKKLSVWLVIFWRKKMINVYNIDIFNTILNKCIICYE